MDYCYGGEGSPAKATQAQDRRCTNCGAPPHLIQTLLDTRHGKSVRLFECKCGKLIWEDE
jgi:hypothetical protein